MRLVNSEPGARLVLCGHAHDDDFLRWRLVIERRLFKNTTDSAFGPNCSLSKHLWFDNIASRYTAEFLEDVNDKDPGVWVLEREWPAVVLNSEECKLRVGGMTLTELRQKLVDYWGQSDGGVAVSTMRRKQLTPDNHRVLSYWVDRECAQWLNYFIARNHTFGAVHAWYAAFLGITKRSLDNLAESVTSIAQSHYTRGRAFKKSINRIKFRMSFDVCIEGHDEVVDGLPSLPSNTVITTNEKGTQIIHDSIRNLFPRRIWDICANTVIPTTWFCGPPCPLTGQQDVGALGVKPISHAWVANEDRNNILTEANQYLWPIPLPKGVDLEDVRGQMIRLGVRYAWLDVLCLRQRSRTTLATGSTIPRAPSTETAGSTVPRAPSTETAGSTIPRAPSTETAGSTVPRAPSTETAGSTIPRAPSTETAKKRKQRRYAWLDVLSFRQRAQPTLATTVDETTFATDLAISISTEAIERREQRRLEEWKVDVPTIGAVYSNLDKKGLYGGGPIIIYMSGLGRPFRAEGWDSERHWLRRAWTLQETPVLSRCIIVGVSSDSDDRRVGWPWSCKV